MDVDRLRSLRKYVFSVPRYYASAVAVVLISIFFGLAMRGHYIFSFLVFGLPALLSAAASTAMTRPWSKSLLIRRSMFLSLISMLITAVFFFLPYAFAPSLLLDSLMFGQAMATFIPPMLPGTTVFVRSLGDIAIRGQTGTFPIKAVGDFDGEGVAVDTFQITANPTGPVGIPPYSAGGPLIKGDIVVFGPGSAPDTPDRW